MDDFEDDDLGVDLTPLIDVIFMLVIFFLMTTTFTLPVIDLNLPLSETAQKEKNSPDALVISIDAQGICYHKAEAISYQDLQKLLEAGSYKNLTVGIDEKAPAQALIDMADLARLYTAGSLTLTVQERSQE